MRPNHLNICLYQPEIPQNTGNIGRLAAATGSRLSLIKPFGFSVEDKNLLRPGLDYWPFLDLEIFDHWQPLFERYKGRIAFFSKKADCCYTSVPANVDLLVFGKETTGLPEEFFETYQECFYSIPIFHPGVRSLNLANAVSIVLYQQMQKRMIF